MEEQGGKAEVNIQANRDYFEKVCPIRAVFEKICVQEEAVPGSHFGIFFHLFRKLRDLSYQPSSEQRYECLFDIVRMGNCLDEAGLEGKEDSDFFKIIKRYRHRVVHGFHAVKPATSDELINTYISYLKTFSDEGKVELFKKKFQKISDEKKLHSYITTGNKREIITKILSQMKYFFEKAKLFSEQGKLDAASLAYISGATCGFDIETFYIKGLKEDKRLNLQKCSATKCIEHYSSRGLSHITELLLIIQDLKAKRTEFFAHQGSTLAKNDSDAYLQNAFLKEYEEKFVKELYVKIAHYLDTEFNAKLLVFEEGSPRAYDPEAIKSGAKHAGQKQDAELEQQKERNVPQAHLGRDQEDEQRRRREDQDQLERQERERRRKDRERREEQNPRDREEEEDRRRKRNDAEQRDRREKEKYRPDGERREREYEEDRRKRREETEQRERRERERRRDDRERREGPDRREREGEERRRGDRREEERGKRKGDDRRDEGESRRSFRK